MTFAQLQHTAKAVFRHFVPSRQRSFEKGAPDAPAKSGGSLKDDLGWKKESKSGRTVFRGHYRAKGLRWAGYVVIGADQRPYFFIENPPSTYIKQSRWANCFRPHPEAGKGWWLVNVAAISGRPITDMESGIAAITRVLNSTVVHGKARP